MARQIADNRKEVKEEQEAPKSKLQAKAPELPEVPQYQQQVKFVTMEEAIMAETLDIRTRLERIELKLEKLAKGAQIDIKLEE